MTTDHISYALYRPLVLLLAVLGSSYAISSAATEADELALSGVKARDVLPPAYFRSVYYEIEDDVARSEYFYRFRIDSDYGTFEVSSLTMLQIRLHEIATIADIMPQLSKSGFSLDRAPPGRRGVGGDSVAGILSDPLGTAGQLMGNLTYNLEETFTARPVTKAAATIAATPSVDKDPGPHKRSAAAQLGVDVYSSNGKLQTVLDILADIRSAGKQRQTVAPAQTALIAPPQFGSGVLDARLRSQLKNSSAAEINEDVDRRLQSFGIDTADRIGLLTHQNYTPRTRLYFAAYLKQFAKAENLRGMVAAAVSATTETDALAFVNLARMAAFLSLNGNKIARIITRHGFPVLLTTENDLVVALPIDYFDWTEKNRLLVAELDELKQEVAANSAAIIVAGRISDKAWEELALREVPSQANYSF